MPDEQPATTAGPLDGKGIADSGHGPVLVTGAAGFAGSHLVELLLEQPAPVVGTYHPRPGGSPSLPRLTPRTSTPLRWLPLDILERADVTRLVAELRPSAVYHCAGAAHVGTSWNRVTPTFELNLLGTHHLLEAIRAAGCETRVVVPGSAMVYRASTEPIDEEHPIGPDSPYALSKLAQEMLAVRVAQDDGLEVVVTRSFNHLGARQDPSFAGSGFAQQIARIEAGLAPPVIRVGNLDARRDFMDVRDTAKAYRALMSRGVPGRVYNVCSGRAYPIRELLDRLLGFAATDVRVEIDPARLRPSDKPVLVGNPGRIQEEVGWRAEIPIEQSLRDMLDYWRERTLQETQNIGKSPA